MQEQQNHCSQEDPARILAMMLPTPVDGGARFTPRPGCQPGHFPDEIPRAPGGPSLQESPAVQPVGGQVHEAAHLGHWNSANQLLKSPETKHEGHKHILNRLV